MGEVQDALAAWNKAPAHVRALAGAYVGPMLAALVALAERIEKIEGGQHGA